MGALRVVRRHLRIARGDITRWPSVDAIVTSANAGLVGNKTPSYWRFRVPGARSGHTRSDVGFEGLGGVAFENCDASVHAASGLSCKLRWTPNRATRASARRSPPPSRGVARCCRARATASWRASSDARW